MPGDYPPTKSRSPAPCPAAGMPGRSVRLHPSSRSTASSPPLDALSHLRSLQAQRHQQRLRHLCCLPEHEEVSDTNYTGNKKYLKLHRTAVKRLHHTTVRRRALMILLLHRCLRRRPLLRLLLTDSVVRFRALRWSAGVTAHGVGGRRLDGVRRRCSSRRDRETTHRVRRRRGARRVKRISA